MQAADIKEQQKLTLTKLSQLYEAIQFDDHDPAKEKILALYEKVKNNRLTISFCGHFSAGKSSLLNHMIDDKLLPASPIPTSGNLIKLRAGEERAVMHLTSGERVNVPAPYSLSEFQAFSKNTALVETIDVYLGRRIHDHVELIDTPGVDSTDEAHQRLTEDALHLADTVMYVTDYNHVQSIVNFHFLQHLQDLKKPYSLVINQVDKHQNSELSFESFKERVETSLEEWGLTPETIYYTTLMEGSEAINDLTIWLDQMVNWLNGRFDHLSANTEDALSSIIDEHLQKREENYQFDLEGKAFENEPSEEAVSLLKEKYNRLNDQLTALLTKEQSFIDVLSDQAKKAADSSILMPYETREFARLYLESIADDFKLGLFTTKKRLENEREKRLQAFYESFLKNSQTMLWNTRDQLAKTAKKEFVQSDNALQGLYDLSLEFIPSLLQDFVRSGAQTNGQYVLTYTETIEDHFKREMKKQAIDWIETTAESFKEETAGEKQKLEAELKNQRQSIDQMAEAVETKQENDLYQNRLLNLLNSEIESNPEAVKKLEHIYQTYEATIPELTLQEAVEKLNKNAEIKENVSDDQSSEHEKVYNAKIETATEDQQKNWVSKLEKAACTLLPLEELNEQREQLKNRAQRIKQNEMTIALFGAFSAGKTSFANALLAERVLPVSPNPTTAVISQIKAPNKTFQHKHVQVMLKTAERLLEDVQVSLSLLNEEIDNLSDLPDKLNVIKNNVQNADLKLHFAFLQAVTIGMSSMVPNLGSTLKMELDDAHDMIANEMKSCFIEHVTIYYDAPLTRQGIVLVDTPGADSINARHTDVAFDYIKNADAILFVTYYNHAFSKADREFLIQLGRVKDTFSMDKMFFIVNASDLAESEQEKEMVINYISDQLLTFGIRNPRLFGVSSKLALEEGAYETSGLPEFSHSLHSFTVNDLLSQTAEAGFSEIKRITKSLKATLQNLELSDEERLEKAAVYEKKLSVAGQILSETKPATAGALNQAINEWFFYVKKRVMQRYLDEFSAYVNPAQFQNKSQNQTKHLLGQLHQLIDFLSFDLDQELRATFLRVESLMNNHLQQERKQLEVRLQTVLPEWEAPVKNSFSFETAPITAHLKLSNIASLSPLTKHFKTSRQFFEKDGQKKLKDELEKILTDPITASLEANKKKAADFYLSAYQESYTLQKSEIFDNYSRQIQTYINQLRTVKNDHDTYLKVHDGLQTILSE